MLNPKEEAKFAELKDKCRELKVPAPPEIFIGLQVHDKNGVLVFDDKQRGHSWTRNFYNFLYLTATYSNGGGAYAAAGQGVKAMNGTVYTSFGRPYNGAYYGWAYGYGFYNNAGNAGSGILVGTGDAAFAAENYILAAIIAHGTGAGQFSYVAMSNSTVAYTAGTKTWKTTWSRVFNNNSGSSITVKEVGLATNTEILGNAFVSGTLMERSVLDPTVAVANGAQLTVTYEISMDFSAID